MMRETLMPSSMQFRQQQLSHYLELADQLFKVVPVYLTHVPVDSSVLVTSSSGFFRLAKFRSNRGSRRS